MTRALILVASLSLGAVAFAQSRAEEVATIRTTGPTSRARVTIEVPARSDLRAHALGIDKDGFKNSFDWFGAGVYTLDARLFAGDVRLR